MNGSQLRTVLDFALRCGETVTGLIHAAALVRPTRLRGMEAKSLRKKMKDNVLFYKNKKIWNANDFADCNWNSHDFNGNGI